MGSFLTIEKSGALGGYPSIGELDCGDKLGYLSRVRGVRLNNIKAGVSMSEDSYKEQGKCEEEEFIDGGLDSSSVDFGGGVKVSSGGVPSHPVSANGLVTKARKAGGNVGLRRDAKLLRWQIADLYASGLSVRQISNQLTIPEKTVKAHVNKLRDQWEAEYETNLVTIKGQLDERLRRDELAIRMRMSKIIEDERREGKSQHSHWRSYMDQIFKLYGLRMDLYRVREGLDGGGGVHLHYTMYNFERVVDKDGGAIPVDLRASKLNDRGVVDMGPAPKAPVFDVDEDAAEIEAMKEVDNGDGQS